MRFQRITVLHDAEPGPGVTEALAAIALAGYTTHRLAVYDDLDVLPGGLRKSRPDLVVNLCTRLAGNPRLVPDVAAALDELGIPYTGAGPAGLYLAHDPALVRRILATHGVEMSFSATDPPGTDLSVALVGNDPLEVEIASAAPRSDASLGVSDEEAWPGQREALVELAGTVHGALRLRDYALLVVRIAGLAPPTLVRSVPNPSLERDGDLARAFLRAGVSYEDLLDRILSAGWSRIEEERRPAQVP